MIVLTSSIGMQPALEALAPRFEGACGRQVALSFGTAARLKERFESGEAFDVAVLMPHMVDDLVQRGIVRPGTMALVAKTRMGMAVRKGAAKPEIGTADALRQALLDARAIAYSKEGHSGRLMAKIVERLGIAAQMAPKTVLETRSGAAAINVVEGKADLAFTIVSEILPFAGAELAALLPAEVNEEVFFAACMSAAATNRDAAQALIDFLKSPAAAPALAPHGLEPA